MGRIGLLTIHDTLNFGSLLQTYGLYHALESLNKDIEILDYNCKAIAARETTYAPSEWKSFRDGVKFVLWHKDLKRQKDNFHKFINSKMQLSKRYTRANINSANEDYDCFIVGSDIVWGMEITGHDLTYFLDFTSDEKKRIAFSSSVGTLWEQDYDERVSSLLHRFDAISVREQLAADWIKDKTGLGVNVTCDPTMLWNGDFWRELEIRDYVPKEKYILIYLMNPDKKNLSDGVKYANKMGYTAYFINFRKNYPGTRSIKPYSVEEWITLFANAEAVFTASYHGLLFSLYFHRKVFYYNRGNKSRMISLGKELGIEHREGTDENIARDIEINYKSVDEIIDNKRTYSWNILKNSLGD